MDGWNYWVDPKPLQATTPSKAALTVYECVISYHLQMSQG